MTASCPMHPPPAVVTQATLKRPGPGHRRNVIFQHSWPPGTCHLCTYSNISVALCVSEFCVYSISRCFSNADVPILSTLNKVRKFTSSNILSKLLYGVIRFFSALNWHSNVLFWQYLLMRRIIQSLQCAMSGVGCSPCGRVAMGVFSNGYIIKYSIYFPQTTLLQSYNLLLC